MISHLHANIEDLSLLKLQGEVAAIKGLMVSCVGMESFLSVGSRCRIYKKGRATHGAPSYLIAEVVGFDGDYALLMPFDPLEGVGPGSKVELIGSDAIIRPHPSWLGRVLDAFGNPIDGKGPLQQGTEACFIQNSPPPAHERARVGGKMNLGIKAINTFLSCCLGQRMGIFAGSGVGKSILMSMLAKYSTAQVNVIGLIGERGREVQEFIEDDLGEEGLKRSVVIVATSSESALMRRLSAYTTMAVAEYFRDEGKDVLCMMDSITRFAMAQREIGLSVGEPPTSKGYTPTVFAELPRLLERAGPGLKGSGSITGLFTVLVEGGDTDEPVSDAVRGILDGHIVLERAIAERGRYPAINILKSVSRSMPDCNTEAENKLVQSARMILSTYEDMAEMIRLGAYRKGSDPKVDQAMRFYPAIEAFISQQIDEHTTLEDCYSQLATIFGLEQWPPESAGGGTTGDGATAPNARQQAKPLPPRPKA